jgi:phosphoserine phosphatase
VDRRSGFVTRNLLSAPMVDLQRRPIGVLQAVNNRSWVGFTGAHETMIRLLADQAGVALQRFRLQQAAVEATYLRREMELAREVQQAMLPKRAPKFPGFTAVGWSKAASVTGGDCFDLWKTDDGRLGIFLGDASGHGVGPALIVSQVRTLVRGMCDRVPDPHDLFACANTRLFADLNPGSFVTGFLAFVSPDGQMHWTSAGHGPILVRRSRDGLIHRLTPPAAPLGIVANYVGKRPRPILLRPGAMMTVMSDGVFDARSPAGDLLETQRVTEFFEQHRARDAQQQLDALRTKLDTWQNGAEPADDQTVVILTRGE